MALIECDECGATVSNKAVACPTCGNPLGGHPSPGVRKNYATNPPKKSATLSVLSWVFALFVIAFFVHQFSDTSDLPAQQDSPTANTSPTPAAPASAPTPVTSSDGGSAGDGRDSNPALAPALSNDNDNNYAAKVAACVRPGVAYPVPPRAGANPTVQYQANLDAQGHVTHVKVQRSSGIKGFDRAVATGIQNCSPFPRPPSGRYPSYVTGDYSMYGNGQRVPPVGTQPFSENTTSASTSATSATSCAGGDLSCWGEKNAIGASVYCPSEIEKLAKYSVKWTDGFLEMKFSRYRWKDKKNDSITYVGDKAQFQNGFGAYANVIYECDLASDGKTVLGVRVDNGRLP